MTGTARRAPLLGLVFVLLINLTGLLPLARVSAAEVQGAALAVDPATAEAGTALAIGGADFAPGEPLDAYAVTPFGQTLALVSSGGDAPVLTVGDPAGGDDLVAAADGSVGFAFGTDANYQTGDWAIVLRGRVSGQEGTGTFTLTPPPSGTATFNPPTIPGVTPVVPSARPSPVAEPSPTATPPATAAPSPTAAPAPATPPAPAAAPSPSTEPAPSTAPTPTASPAASAAPGDQGTPSPSASAAPSPAPATPPAGSPSPAPTAAPATPTPSTSPTPSPAPTPETSATPSPVPSAAPSPAPSPAAPPAPPASPGIGPGVRVIVNSPTGSATIREQPATGAAPVRTVNNGTLLTVTGASRQAEGGTWWPVEVEGVGGWVTATVITLAPTPRASPSAVPAPSPAIVPTAIGPGVRVIVNAPGDGANLRAQPSTSAPIVLVVANGAVLTVVGASQDADGYTWWPVQAEGGAGWIVADLLTLTPGTATEPGTSPVPGLPGYSSPGQGTLPPDNGPGVPPPVDGPAVAPEQLLPIFERAAALTGIPREILLAIARVESGFDPRAIGPYLPQFAGTENEHALGMMQFLPSTYRMVMPRVDATTGKNLGIQGIWDAESSIYAAAFYLQDSGAPGDLRRALFAYNNADWYVDLIIAWANNYAAGLVTDPNFTLPTGGAPLLAAPQNPLLPSNSRHLDMLSPIQLYAPWTAGQTWYAGGDGSFYGDGYHTDQYGNYYTVDFNKGAWPRSEEDDGAPVLAVADGIVNNIYQDGAGAWVVELYHIAPDGTQLRTLYVHLKVDPRINPGIKTNQAVLHGTPIGLVGNTGNSTGPHLHFGLWMLKDGQWMSIRPEPMEGQYLQNGLSIISTNRPAAIADAPRGVDFGFSPHGPSNADLVTVATAGKPGATPLSRVEVYANSAKDGSDRGQWLPVGTVQGGTGQVAWTTAPVADGTYRLLFVLIDEAGNRAFHGLTAETAVRYTVRRGEPRGSIVVNPRSDISLLAPLDGVTLARLGVPGPVVSGPLRFVPVAGSSPSTPPLAAGATIVATGGTTSARIRAGRGVIVEEATTNLIPNPSFERGGEGWVARATTEGTFVVTPSDGALVGKYSIRLDNSKGADPAVFAVTAGDGATATWSIHARGVPPPPPSPSPSASPAPASEPSFGSIGLAMTGVSPQEHALTGEWQRFTLTGAAVGGTERLVIVPPGTVVELDAAQLEPKPYATSYADGSFGPGYGWDRAADASLSGRLPNVLAQPLVGLVSAERGAISFWATPIGPVADGAILLALGDRLRITIAGGTATLRWGEEVIGSAPWQPGVTSHYALTWESGIVTFLQDGKVIGQHFLADFALTAGTTLYLGSDAAGAHAANAAFQDLALWRGAPTPDIFAALVGPGEYLRPGLAETVTLNVGLALATQGLAPSGIKMQFSFDGNTWTDPEPFAPTKTLTLPDRPGDHRIYVRFTDDEGRTIVVTDRIQIVPPQRPVDDGGAAAR